MKRMKRMKPVEPVKAASRPLYSDLARSSGPCTNLGMMIACSRCMVTPTLQPPTPAPAGHPTLPAPIPPEANPGSGPLQWRGKLEQLLESTGEGIFGIDTQGCCTFINRAGAAMLGWQPAEVLGRNMHLLAHHTHVHAQGGGALTGTPSTDAHHPNHYPEHLCPIFNAFRRGLPCRIDSEYFWRQDGSAFAVEYSSYPVLEADQVQGAVVTFVDISARRQTEAALKQAHAALEQRVSERTHELSAALSQLRQLTAYTHRVREDERTRIAREIHDELGSLLVALKMDLGWLDKRLGEQQQRGADAAQSMRSTLQDKCRGMGRQIERAVDNVGRIITDLRPSILDHQGLWAALDWQAHEFVQSAELTLDWQVDVANAPPLPEPSAIGIFRIFQEMLSNVGRHARASRIAIAIHAVPGEIRISVSDDGCGAEAAAFDAPDAYGVMGMRERARSLGGNLQINSQIGLGSACLLHIVL